MFDSNFDYWKNKQAIIKNKRPTKQLAQRVLIEIAAQHPLKNGNEPDIEFESRLKEAIELYRQEENKGNNVIFYIPGSIHSINRNGEKVEDLVPLAEAGKQYLIKQGIPLELIRANDVNTKYKGEKGVYNSGDECYVSSRIYAEEECDRLISVVSPVQVFRKALFYNELGIQPEMHSVPLENTAHNYIGELFWSLYVTTFIDHNWQGDTSFLSVLTRVERCKGYECNLREKNTLDNKRIVIPQKIMQIRENLIKKYNQAADNMKTNTQSNKVLIQILTSEKPEGEISKAIELCKKQQEKEKKVVVVLPNKKDAIRFYASLQQENIDDIDIKVTEDVVNEFNNQREYEAFYSICQADKSMRNAISLIEKGVIPLIVTVPNTEDNYVQEVFDLYNSVIGRDLIDLSDEPGVPIESKIEVMRGLLLASEIDVENLPDVLSYEWSSNMTEGEYGGEDQER